MITARNISQVIFDEVTTAQESSWIDISEMQDSTFFIAAYSVTTGGTIQIQAQSPTGAAHVIHSEPITTTDFDTVVVLEGCYGNIRAKLTDVTDGTYNVSLIAKPIF